MSDVEYEVEAIRDHRVIQSEEQFLVKWKGYPEEDNTWEIESQLNCNKLIRIFRKKMKNDIKSAQGDSKSPKSTKGKIILKKPKRSEESSLPQKLTQSPKSPKVKKGIKTKKTTLAKNATQSKKSPKTKNTKQSKESPESINDIILQGESIKYDEAIQPDESIQVGKAALLEESPQVDELTNNNEKDLKINPKGKKEKKTFIRKCCIGIERSDSFLTYTFLEGDKKYSNDSLNLSDFEKKLVVSYLESVISFPEFKKSD